MNLPPSPAPQSCWAFSSIFKNIETFGSPDSMTFPVSTQIGSVCAIVHVVLTSVVVEERPIGIIFSPSDAASAGSEV